MKDAIVPNTAYNIEEARKLLGLSRTTLRLLVREGKLKGRKIGKQWRFLGSDLLELLERSILSTEEPR